MHVSGFTDKRFRFSFTKKETEVRSFVLYRVSICTCKGF